MAEDLASSFATRAPGRALGRAGLGGVSPSPKMCRKATS